MFSSYSCTQYSRGIFFNSVEFPLCTDFSSLVVCPMNSTCLGLLRLCNLYLLNSGTLPHSASLLLPVHSRNSVSTTGWDYFRTHLTPIFQGSLSFIVLWPFLKNRCFTYFGCCCFLGQESNLVPVTPFFPEVEVKLMPLFLTVVKYT